MERVSVLEIGLEDIPSDYEDIVTEEDLQWIASELSDCDGLRIAFQQALSIVLERHVEELGIEVEDASED